MKFYPVAQILRFSEELANNSDLDILNKKATFMKLILAHEMGHVLGLEEIYRDDYDDQTQDELTAHRGGDVSCLMAKWSLAMYDLFNSTVDKSTLLCQYCRDKLEEIMPEDLFVEGQFD